MKLALLLLIASSSFNYTSFAKDFGVHGHTFPILEEDILKYIEKKLANLDMNKINKDMQDKTVKYVESPTPPKNITRATENKIFYYDPTYILQEDIRDHNNISIHAKGTQINPLAQIPLKEDLAFIDGNDELQVKLALDTRKLKNDRLKIILVKGSPLDLQRKHKIWIYFDQAGFITSKLNIKEIPAFVSQEGLRLKIDIRGELK